MIDCSLATLLKSIDREAKTGRVCRESKEEFIFATDAE